MRIRLSKIKAILEGIEEGLYDKWLQNCNPDYVTERFYEKGERFVSNAFMWDDTPQGIAFWSIRHDKAESIIIDMRFKYWFNRELPDNVKEWSKFPKRWFFRKEGGRTCVAAWEPENQLIRVYAGCFVGTIDEFESKATKRYANNEKENYAKHIAWLRELELKMQNNGK